MGMRSAGDRRIMAAREDEREAAMNVRKMALSLCLLAVGSVAGAAQGLAVPAADTLWPQWQARITVMTTHVIPSAATPWFDNGASARGLQGGAVFGDYIFASPSFGSFRASGGLMSGGLGGLPLLNINAGSRLGVSLLSGNAPAYVPGSEAPATLPYVGLGFTGATGLAGLAITADLGVTAERPSAATGLGRALFGNQGMERSLREMRLGPVMQLGVRYTF